MSRSHFLVCLFLLTAPLSGQTDSAIPSVPPGTNLKDPNALLPLAIAANSLDRPGVPPYYLKATYETFDEQGKQQDSGTFEEWRLAPEKWKRTYTGAHFSQTEYETSAGIYYETSAGAAPWPVSLVAKELVHPGPEEWETKDAKPELRQLDTKPIKLSCLMLTSSARKTQWRLGVLPTYCFDEASTMLRIGIFNSTMQAIRNEIAVFNGVYLAKDIALSDDSKPLLRIHLTSIASMRPEEVAAANALAGFGKIIPANQIEVPAEQVRSNKIGGPVPGYPAEAKRERMEGKVVMRVIIGRDGRIHHLRLLSSPDPRLSMAAITAVQRWIYRPITSYGYPISVQTDLTVTFIIGH